MHTMNSAKTNIFIAGAGPTGMTLALALACRGVIPRIIDKRPGPVQQSRAMGVQARTLEFYRFMGIADDAVKLGIPARNVHLMRQGEEIFHFSIAEMGKGISPYPYLLTLAQDVHEDFLLEELKKRGVFIEWDTGLSHFEHDSEGVTVHIKTNDDQQDTLRCDYLIGCDGAGSIVREGLELDFSGGTNEGLFYVADVDTDKPSDDIFAGFAENTLALMFPVRTTGAQRLIGVVRPDLASKETIDFNDFKKDPETILGIKVSNIHWFSTYHVHHRVAEKFQLGRVFIAGDAGHIHSPVGGQGMNTGIGDSINLAWKLAAVIKGQAAEAILKTYSAERIPFAHRLVETTDSMFGPIVAESHWATFLRTILLPNALRVITHMPGLPKMLFRTISQTRITYRDSELSQGVARGLRAGDRLPWVEMNNGDNYVPLSSLDWQVHIYGQASDEVRTLFGNFNLDLHVFAWQDAFADKDIRQDVIYLIRPDGYIGLIVEQENLDAFNSYVKKYDLKFCLTK